jgi:3D (Asp-Asp-Asp) domain-containing protein
MHVSRILAFAVAVLFSACARPLPKYEKPIARTQFQHVRTTAYTHSESDHLEHGRRTCLGTQLRCGAVKSAAADWSRWPAGTLFRITETGEVYEVDDIGWALSGRNTLDLYKPSRSAMNAWGARMVNIEILRWGDDRDSLAVLSKRTRHRHVRRMVDGLEHRIARGETNPEPMVASVPAVVPSTVAVSAPAPVTVPAAGGVLRPFRQPIQ